MTDTITRLVDMLTHRDATYDALDKEVQVLYYEKIAEVISLVTGIERVEIYSLDLTYEGVDLLTVKFGFDIEVGDTIKNPDTGEDIMVTEEVLESLMPDHMLFMSAEVLEAGDIEKTVEHTLQLSSMAANYESFDDFISGYVEYMRGYNNVQDLDYETVKRSIMFEQSNEVVKKVLH